MNEAAAKNISDFFERERARLKKLERIGLIVGVSLGLLGILGAFLVHHKLLGTKYAVMGLIVFAIYGTWTYMNSKYRDKLEALKIASDDLENT